MSGNDPGWHRAFVALGANIEPEDHLPAAAQHLCRLGTVEAVSGVYESPPVDGSAQANYLNAAVLLRTALSPVQLCREALPAIELALGRVRDPQDRFAPRTIDLDLVLYDTATLTIDHRRIPDPEIAERAFLAIPLAELHSEYVVPQIDRTLEELAAPHRAASNLRLRPDVVLPCRAESDHAQPSPDIRIRES